MLWTLALISGDPQLQNPSVREGEFVSAKTRLPAISPSDRGPGVGKWIWLPDGDGKTAVRFRKTINLAEAPSRVRAWITADIRYRLWINGKFVSRGPADPGRDYDSGPPGPWFEDVREVGRYFHPGLNVVAAEVFQTALVSSEWPTKNPALKIDLKFPGSVLGTDSSWRSAPAADLNQKLAQNYFRIDLTKEPVGWQNVSFDDAGWGFATLAERPDPRTLVSELAPPMEVPLKPVGFDRVTPTVRPNLSTGGAQVLSDGSYTVKYGHVLSGYVCIRVRGHKGARLLLEPNERDAQGVSRGAEILLRDGEQMVELPFLDSFSVVNIKAEQITAPIDIEEVICNFSSYPVSYLGKFECDRPEWNQLWNVSRWVTQICMQTHYLDSPNHQEPVSDAGDYLIESLNGFYAFGDPTLARQDLKKIGRTLKQRHYQSFHTSYSLLWLRMLMQYYQYSGDEEPIKELASDVFALLDRFKSYIGPNGLISNAPNYMFMDWVDIDGFNAHHPPAVIGQGYMTALYYRALADGMSVANLVGDPLRREEFKALRVEIARSFDRELWAPTKGLYRDGKPFQTSVSPNQWLPADRDIETFTTQVNALAVVCGLTDTARSGQIVESLLKRPDLNCQPYFMSFVFDAIERGGLFDQLAPAQIDRWKVVPDTQSFWEMWNSGDLSHAWNATILFQLSGRVLGVTPLTPGFATFEIAPHACGLKWAKGAVPTPHGIISIAWTRSSRGIRLTATVPKETTAVVRGQSFGPGKHTILLSPEVMEGLKIGTKLGEVPQPR
jgi:alpha-L-rhamnosidase